MSTVVRLADFRNDRAGCASAAVSGSGRSDAPTFTPRDRCDLEGWVGRNQYVSFDTCELGDFAMLYRRGAAWASWGVVRQEQNVLVWDCVTHADIGTFASMVDALAALPVARVATSRSVLPFAASPPRYAALR